MWAIRAIRAVLTTAAFAAILGVAPAWHLAASEQDTVVSSTGTKASSTEDASTTDLPVSLDRIRDKLAQPAPLEQSLQKRPTFRVEVEQKKSLQELLSEIDFDLKSHPAPPGGLYMYDQQRRMFDSVHNPLMQPYAAFSGGEFLTLAIETLIQKYLGGKVLSSLTTAERERAKAAARAEVATAIAQYCAGLPAGGAGIGLCSEANMRGTGLPSP